MARVKSTGIERLPRAIFGAERGPQKLCPFCGVSVRNTNLSRHIKTLHKELFSPRPNMPKTVGETKMSQQDPEYEVSQVASPSQGQGVVLRLKRRSRGGEEEDGDQLVLPEGAQQLPEGAQQSTQGTSEMTEEVFEPEGAQMKEETPWGDDQTVVTVSDEEYSVAVTKQEHGGQCYSPTSGISLSSAAGLKAKLFKGQSTGIQEAKSVDFDVGMSDSELEWRLRELYTTPNGRPTPGLSLEETGLVLSLLNKPVKCSGLEQLLSTKGLKLVKEDVWQSLVGEAAKHPPGVEVLTAVRDGQQEIVVSSAGVWGIKITPTFIL